MNIELTDITLSTQLNRASAELSKAAIETPRLDARVLLKKILGCGDEFLLAHPEQELTHGQIDRYQSWIDRRGRHEPLAKITCEREFWGHPFYVTQDTLDPRADTETLIEAVLQVVEHSYAPLRILDLGTGTGCLLLALLQELPNASGVGVDLCSKALKVAQSNAKRLQLEGRAILQQGNWTDGLEGVFDIIVSNPPYIATQEIAELSKTVKDYDPHLALDGGPDGLDCYRALMPQIPSMLAPGGYVALEVGVGQDLQVRSMMKQLGFSIMKTVPDLAGIARCVLARQTQNNEEV